MPAGNLSATEVCNLALSILGEKQITAIDADNVDARRCNVIFLSALDSFISKYDWNCARAWAVLSYDVESDADDWEGYPNGKLYRFILPVDPYCLNVISEKNNTDFLLGERYLYADEADITIAYTRQLRDIANLSAYLIMPFVYFLAAQLGTMIGGSPKRSRELSVQAEREFGLAIIRNEQERSVPSTEEEYWSESEI